MRFMGCSLNIRVCVCLDNRCLIKKIEASVSLDFSPISVIASIVLPKTLQYASEWSVNQTLSK